MLDLSVVIHFYCIDWIACYQLPGAPRPTRVILPSLIPSAPYLATPHLSLHKIGSKHIPSYFAFRIVLPAPLVLSDKSRLMPVPGFTFTTTLYLHTLSLTLCFLLTNTCGPPKWRRKK